MENCLGLVGRSGWVGGLMVEGGEPLGPEVILKRIYLQQAIGLLR